MVAAPILIDGQKILCGVTLKRNNQHGVSPIAIVLKDKDGTIISTKKLIGNISVPDNSNGNSTFGNNHCGDAITSQDANQPLDNANIQQKSDIDKELYKENKIYRKIMRKNNKIRLSESQLRQVINESVMKLIKENENEDMMNSNMQSIKIDISEMQRYVGYLSNPGISDRLIKCAQHVIECVNAYKHYSDTNNSMINKMHNKVNNLPYSSQTYDA